MLFRSTKDLIAEPKKIKVSKFNIRFVLFILIGVCKTVLLNVNLESSNTFKNIFNKHNLTIFNYTVIILKHFQYTSYLNIVLNIKSIYDNESSLITGMVFDYLNILKIASILISVDIITNILYDKINMEYILYNNNLLNFTKKKQLVVGKKNTRKRRRQKKIK